MTKTPANQPSLPGFELTGMPATTVKAASIFYHPGPSAGSHRFQEIRFIDAALQSFLHPTASSAKNPHKAGETKKEKATNKVHLIRRLEQLNKNRPRSMQVPDLYSTEPLIAALKEISKATQSDIDPESLRRTCSAKAEELGISQEMVFSNRDPFLHANTKAHKKESTFPRLLGEAIIKRMHEMIHANAVLIQPRRPQIQQSSLTALVDYFDRPKVKKSGEEVRAMALLQQLAAAYRHELTQRRVLFGFEKLPQTNRLLGNILYTDAVYTLASKLQREVVDRFHEIKISPNRVTSITWEEEGKKLFSQTIQRLVQECETSIHAIQPPIQPSEDVRNACKGLREAESLEIIDSITRQLRLKSLEFVLGSEHKKKLTTKVLQALNRDMESIKQNRQRDIYDKDIGRSIGEIDYFDPLADGYGNSAQSKTLDLLYNAYWSAVAGKMELAIKNREAMLASPEISPEADETPATATGKQLRRVRDSARVPNAHR
jgi:hypothetical protein